VKVAVSHRAGPISQQEVGPTLEAGGRSAFDASRLRRAGFALLSGAGLFSSLMLLAGTRMQALLPLATAWGAGVALSAWVAHKPQLRRERSERPADAVEPTFHFWLMAALVCCNLLSVPLLLRADVGFVGSPSWLNALAALGVFAGLAWTCWSVAANPFYSLYIRNQEDQGHHAVARGPYRYMRHPGYFGMVLTNLAHPLFGGTLWGLVPALVYVGIILRRTAFEDRWAAGEIAGYGSYCQRVRWRLIPKVW
jgi:protein-S-isoprenylcysteine O-methyltransferase Ste14